jgi:hypothetical protein
VFEKMRDARDAGLLIRRAGPVPDHVHHDGGAVVLDHDDLHPVRKREVGDHVLELGRPERQGERGECQRGGDEPFHRRSFPIWFRRGNAPCARKIRGRGKAATGLTRF